MKRNLLIVSSFLGSFAFSQDCSDLFISEYVEGWSNNKALEIYNPTASTIDLSQYIVIRYSNGSTSAGAEYAVQLSGSLAPYDVYVGVLDKQNPLGTGQEAPVWDSLAVRADGWYSPDYNTNKTWYWNGNDAVVLAKGSASNPSASIVVDIFGKIGENPGPDTGWSTGFPYNNETGEIVTQDHSMLRKSTVLAGQTNPTISFFNPLEEWDSIPPVVDIAGQLYGNWFTLGEHTCDCEGLNVEESDIVAPVSIFPNPTSGNFTIANVAQFEKVVIVNALGQTVETFNNPVNILDISLKERKGVYFVHMSAADGSKLTRRVILK